MTTAFLTREGGYWAQRSQNPLQLWQPYAPWNILTVLGVQNWILPEEESEKFGLQLNIQKTKIMDPVPSFHGK